MVSEPVLVASDLAVVMRRPSAVANVVADYWSITKPEVNFLIVITTAAGYYLASLASREPFSWTPFVQALAGTVLVASGAASLNQWMEHPFDARMRRTARRAIASGRIEPAHALMFGTGLSVVGVAYLTLTAGTLPASLAAGTLLGYLLLYTPLKRRSPLCTLVGAVPGALPALIGWAAARGRLDPGAWELFAIVFLWQFPHVMAIAWMYRDDYERAGYAVLPSGDTRRRFVDWHTLAPLVALALVCVLSTTFNSSAFCSAAVLALSAWFFHVGTGFVLLKSAATARRLLMASILYLPALLLLIVLFAR